MNKPTKGLRFAPLIRVSTPEQEDKKHSLETQTERIKDFVQLMGGMIPKSCWEYCGQEHATPEFERAKFDQLLVDCSKNKFDAVIVYDVTRWSRDIFKHAQSLNIFKQNKIRFFIGMLEQDLFDPNYETQLGMQVLLAQHQARYQKQRSILSRIKAARDNNKPTTGRLPYGRIYDGRRWDGKLVPEEERKAGWDLDKSAVKKIQQAAKRYLSGDKMPDIAASLGMNHANLWKILTRTSGDKWPIHFEAKDLNIDQKVTLTIPRLLEDDVIKAIHEKAEANKTYTHGEIKHHYLLGRVIFCAKCGYSMFGQTNRQRSRYYRHAHTHRVRTCDGKHKWIPADEIEDAVLIALVRTYGDKDAMQRAIERAIPNKEKLQALSEEQQQLKRNLKVLVQKQDRAFAMVIDGQFTESQAQNTMNKLEEERRTKEARLDAIAIELRNYQDPVKIRKMSKYWQMDLEEGMREMLPHVILRKPYSWKRRRIEQAFAGLDAQRRRLGVYVTETDDPNQPWKYEIRGAFNQVLTDADYYDEIKEVREKRTAVTKSALHL